MAVFVLVHGAGDTGWSWHRLAAVLRQRGHEWWSNTGFAAAVEVQAARDGGLTGNDDPFVGFYHDVPRGLAEEAMSRERAHPSAASMAAPWPLASWPSVTTKFIVCAEDRFFPSVLLRELALERLGVVADEIRASHCVALSRPDELASMLVEYSVEARRS